MEFRIICSTKASASRVAGNTLISTICVTAIIGMALATYLQLVSSQNQLTVRSQVWNSCMPVLEAGIEEALTHCTDDFMTNMVSNGWQQSGALYVKTNQVGDGYYFVQISQSLPYEILSTGYYPMPGSSAYVSRTVKVTTRNKPIFTGAIVLRDTINLNGNNVMTDSYDSRDPLKSTLGLYDPLKAGDKGDVGCVNGIANAFSVGNANIWGHVFVSAPAAVIIGPNGAVGDVVWQRSNMSGIEPGWLINDFSLNLPDVKPPFASAPAPGSGTIAGINYTLILANGNYMSSFLSGSVLVTGKAVLYVTGDINFGSSDSLVVAPGASLKIYAGGANTTINTVVNDNGLAGSLQYYGLPSNTSITIKGGGDLTAAIYAPEAAVTLSGNGTLYGSIVANKAVLSGNAAVHFDEALMPVMPAPQIVVASWNEL